MVRSAETMAIHMLGVLHRGVVALLVSSAAASVWGLESQWLYNETTLSAAAVFSAKTFGVMNWAFFVLRSPSVTPRATEHRPQTKIGTCLATTASSISRK